MRKLIAIIAVFAALSAILPGSGAAEEYFILCSPKTEINVRKSAKRSAERIGYLQCGDNVETDGRKKNGFAHCVDMNTESGEGWVYAGYLVPDKPIRYDGSLVQVVSNGRVKCRQYVNGKRQGWLNDGDQVRVYAYSAEWAATNKGFIRTEFLNIGN